MKRVFTVASLALALCAAASPGLASAEPLPGHLRTWTTDDGWKGTISSSSERVGRVGPLTSTGTTREAFITLRGEASLTPPKGRPVNPTKGVLLTGFMVGCAVNLTTITPSVGANFGIAGVGGGSGGKPTLTVTPQALMNIGLSLSMTPGKVETISFGKKPFNGADGPVSTTVRQGHLAVGGCAGPVSVRSFAVLETSSKAADDSNAVYGRVWKF